MTLGFGRRLATVGSMVFAVAVLGEGCGEPQCPAGSFGPYDNRDRTMFPNTDQDWVCIVAPKPTPPLVPPDLEGYRPMTDAKYRDHPSVARAAIFLQSCDPGYFFKGFNVTDIIEATYGAVMTSVFEQALLDHSNCFRQKHNGCDAVRECLGIAFTPTNPAFTPGCNVWVAMTRFEAASGTVYDVWTHCMINSQESDKGVDLMCYPTPEPHCGTGRVNCSAKLLEPHCADEPVNCRYSSIEDRLVFEHWYPCTEYGLVCGVTDNEAKCMGDGPACDEVVPKDQRFFMDFRTGAACVDDVTLQACVNGHETLVNCANRGLNIKCIDGSRPHCGADFQCNYEGTNAPPTCEGTLIHVCNAGVPMTFDCTELGFETCDPVRGACKPKALDAQP